MWKFNRAFRPEIYDEIDYFLKRVYPNSSEIRHELYRFARITSKPNIGSITLQDLARYKEYLIEDTYSNFLFQRSVMHIRRLLKDYRHPLANYINGDNILDLWQQPAIMTPMIVKKSHRGRPPQLELIEEVHKLHNKGRGMGIREIARLKQREPSQISRWISGYKYKKS